MSFLVNIGIEHVSPETIHVIVELGELYKKINPSWVYTDLYWFVVNNFESAMEFCKEHDHSLPDYCDAIEEWYKQNCLEIF